ncbi:hypothetical protein EJB05_26075, partial [Eragrostis curvula]
MTTDAAFWSFMTTDPATARTGADEGAVCQGSRRDPQWGSGRGPDKLPAERPKWKLAFQVPPKLPIITGEYIWDTNGNPLEVILVDVDTGEPASTLPDDTLQIELVPLLSNFPRVYWDANDFQRGMAREGSIRASQLASTDP